MHRPFQTSLGQRTEGKENGEKKSLESEKLLLSGNLTVSSARTGTVQRNIRYEYFIIIPFEPAMFVSSFNLRTSKAATCVILE